jgi:arabinofuranosyltransferase
VIPEEPLKRVVLLAALALYLLLLVRTSWVADDAYITLRVVDNTLSGFGPRWNVAERVQVYTHPLWFLALTLTDAIARNAYWSALVLGWTASLATVAILAWRFASRDPLAAAGLVASLALSRAYVDYSTSGLENPLTHLLLAAFALTALSPGVWDDRRIGLAALLAGLLVTNRMDALLLVAPTLLYRIVAARRARALAVAAASFTPFVVWELFAIVYYGSAWPNTALAKLNTGIPAGEMIGQGVLYLVDAVHHDPITPALIVAGLASAFGRRRPADLALGCGLAIYLFYVIRIGGDFMAGRFLTPLLLLGAILLTERMTAAGPRARGLSGATLLALGAYGILPTLPPGRVYAARVADVFREHGIADERRFYFAGSGLFNGVPGWVRPTPSDPFVNAGEDLRRNRVGLTLERSIGYLGFVAGPSTHIVDSFAIGDPLLARLPAERNDTWRIGHFRRTPPEGYLASLATGENRVREPALHALWDRVERVSRGPLFTRARFADIAALAFGHAGAPRVRRAAEADPWEELLAADPRSAEAHYKIAAAALRAGDDATAAVSLAVAVALAPEHERALAALARVHERRGDFVTAWEIVGRARALSPFDPIAIGTAADVAAARGDDAAASALYLESAELYPQVAGRAFGRLAMLAARRRDAAQALDFVERAVALAGEDAETLANVGEAYALLGRATDARRAYGRALTADPAFAPAARGLQRLGR